MKERIKTFFCVLFLLTALPYIITMCFNRSASADGSSTGNSEQAEGASFLSGMGETDASDAGGQDGADEVDVEEYVIGIVADEIPITYEAETLKAQAVIARTNLMSALEKGEELPEIVSQEKLLDMWGDEGFNRNYQRLTEAVKATEGVVLTSQGNYIYAAFHAVSAGKTRNAQEALGSKEMPWLAGADSTQDIPSEDYLKVVFVEKEKLVQMLKEDLGELSVDAEKPLEGIAIASRDSAEYVTQVKIGEKTVSGEEFRSALELNSACFYLKEVEGKIRIVTKGLGHGLGLSQYGANELALEGMTYTEILGYYFKNVDISD